MKNKAVTTLYPYPPTLPKVAELPDPFLTPFVLFPFEGRYKAQNRAELQEWFGWHLARIERYQYGELPPRPKGEADQVAGELIARSSGSDAVTEEWRLAMGPGRSVTTPLFLTIPPGEGPFPVIITGDLGWRRVAPEIVAEVVRRGYMLAEFSREAIAPDSELREGVYAAFPDYEGGRLAAWAWGFHRVTDYLLTRPETDAKRVIVTGHSRGGKAALLAGAQDDRIALTAPNNSGCGGAGCYRFQAEGSEDIGAILKNFPYWFHPRFAHFVRSVQRLPFDQHTLKAAIAPRCLLTTEALDDLWANPHGTQITHLAAKPVFDFLGVSENIGIVFRQGGHQQGADDWAALLDFADARLFGKTVERRFDILAFPVSESEQDV